MDEVVEDEQDGSDDGVIDEKGNEDSVSKQPASPDANVEIGFGLVTKADGFEVHKIVVEEEEVFGIGCEMFAVYVYSDNKRPEYSYYEDDYAKSQVESLASILG